MKQNFEAALKHVLVSEGGYVDHPADPGGRTNLGVTQKVWEEWVGHDVDEQTMRSLTPEMVAPLYEKNYWDRIKADNLPSGVDYAVFDASVNSGVSRAIRWLQACVNVDADGVIGPKTLAAVNAANPDTLIDDYSKRRLSFLMDLKHWPTFGRGWSRRVNEVDQQAKKMAG